MFGFCNTKPNCSRKTYNIVWQGLDIWNIHLQKKKSSIVFIKLEATEADNHRGEKNRVFPGEKWREDFNEGMDGLSEERVDKVISYLMGHNNKRRKNSCSWILFDLFGRLESFILFCTQQGQAKCGNIFTSKMCIRTIVIRGSSFYNIN